MKNLCELVEQSREGRERAGKSREKEGKVQVFPIFDEARRAPFWVAGAVCGATAAGGPSEMQESERKYKWYYSPKCTFKNEKKAGREKTMDSVLTRAKKCAKIAFVFEKDAGVA